MAQSNEPGHVACTAPAPMIASRRFLFAYALLLGLVACKGDDTAPADLSMVAVPDLAGPTDEAVLASPWKLLATAPKIIGKQDDLFFVTTEEGWSVNGDGHVFHTKDGGASWEMLLEQPGTYFRAVLFLDAMHGFVSNIGVGYYPGVTDARPLFRTSDGGKTFTEVTEITGPKPTGICNLTMVDAQHLFASGRVGGPSFFMKSSDGGQTWTSKDMSSQIPMLIDVHFATPMEGVLIGGTSTGTFSETIILRTTDGGETFTPAYTSANNSGEMGWKFSFPSDKVGFASILAYGGGNAAVLKTTDGGASWKQVEVAPEPFEGKGVGFLNENIGWLGGGIGKQPGYRTLDGGLTWSADASLGPYINRFRFIGGKTGYAIGGGIQKLTLP